MEHRLSGERVHARTCSVYEFFSMSVYVLQMHIIAQLKVHITS